MIECKDGVCYLVEATNDVATAVAPAVGRLAHGYMSADDFVSFLNGAAPMALDGSVGAVLAAVFFGGLALNLTPCVLPMIPVNAMIIGRRVKSGILYGLGIALAYGALGLAATFGGIAFGTLQASPWFNVAVAAVFVLLALGLLGAFPIDLSRFRGGFFAPRGGDSGGSVFLPLFMGVVSSLLAGACVAPVVISVLLLAADLGARGSPLAFALPFVLGLGMASPWPFVAAGLKVLPRPGKWMRWVNVGFAIVVLGFAGWYGRLAALGFTRETTVSAASDARPGDGFDDVPVAQLAEAISTTARPVVVDCWASWCKNCAAMEGVLAEPKVKEALRRYTVLRVQAEDLSELKKVKGFEGVKGLPAFVVFD